MAFKERGTSKEPSEWATSGQWRKWTRFDVANAKHLRAQLRFGLLLMDAGLDERACDNTLEANYRATFPEVVAELSRADFLALWRVARLLALSGRQQVQGPLFDYLRSLEVGDS